MHSRAVSWWIGNNLWCLPCHPEGAFMDAKILLKHEEKEYLLQRTAENSPARSILARALPDENQPALVVFSCNEQTAYAVLEIAERHCGSAWRVMHYQMVRLGLLTVDRFDHPAWHQHPECHVASADDDRGDTGTNRWRCQSHSSAFCDRQTGS